MEPETWSPVKAGAFLLCLGVASLAAVYGFVWVVVRAASNALGG